MTYFKTKLTILSLILLTGAVLAGVFPSPVRGIYPVAGFRKRLAPLLFCLILPFFFIAFFLGTKPAFGANQSIFTISVWVKPSGSAVSKAIVGKSEEFRVATNASSQPVCQIKSGSAWQTAATSSAAISVGSWSHVSCTYDLAYVRIFVNGIEKGSQALAVAADDTSAVVKIGRDDSASTPYGYFAGQIDEFKFYTSALSAEQIKLDMNQGKELQLGGQSSATGATGQAAEYCVPGDATSCAGPVGEWKFDEKTGGSVNDTSGNGNLGTWSGTGTHWTRGKYGSAGSFNGTDDYVDLNIGGQTKIIEGQSAFTISTWNRCTLPNATEKLNFYAVTGGGLYWRSISATGVSLYLINSTGVGQVFTTINESTLCDGNWHMLSVTIESNGTVKGYFDGKLDSTNTFTAGDWDSVYDDGDSYAIGRYSSRRHEGQIDDVKIFNYARTPSQIAWDYNRGKPVGWWKLDEGEGISAYDSSGNANTGTMTLMDPPNDWVAGKFGKALDFDGNGDYVNVPDSSNYQFGTGDFSLSAWVKSTSSDTILAVGRYSGSGNDYWLGFNGGKATFSISGTPITELSATANDGNWHLLTGIRSSGNIYIYVDGKLRNSVANSLGASPSGYLGIGKFGSGANFYWNGQIDDVRVYNYALTPLQIQQIMNEGSQIRFGE